MKKNEGARNKQERKDKYFDKCFHSTSWKMPSISTLAFAGKPDTPKALLTPTPRSSPQISRNSSLQPLITFACSAKSGFGANHPHELYNTFDFIQAAKSFSETSQDIQPNHSSSFSSSFNCNILTDLSSNYRTIFKYWQVS